MDAPDGYIVDGTAFIHCPQEFDGDFSVPVGIRTIGATAFSMCSLITSVHIPNGCKALGAQAFRGCESLTCVCLPASMESIGRECFSACKALAYAIVPETCSIGELAFPESCHVFKGTPKDYRTHIIQSLVEQHANDAAEVVGMHAPQTEKTIDSRGGRDI